MNKVLGKQSREWVIETRPSSQLQRLQIQTSHAARARLEHTENQLDPNYMSRLNHHECTESVLFSHGTEQRPKI